MATILEVREDIKVLGVVPTPEPTDAMFDGAINTILGGGWSRPPQAAA